MSAFVRAGTRFPVAVTKAGKGRVTSTPAGINCGTVCSRTFPAGKVVRLEAVPDKGWQFVRWSGACRGRKPACALALDGAKSIAATFARAEDPAPPRVRALASTGTLGHVVRLRYRVTEDSGQSRETATVFRGSTPLAMVRGTLHEVDPDALYSFLPWRATARGALRFCVTSRDPAGNRSTPSCAPLQIR